MSKIVRLDEDVYSELKARATQEGKTLSKAISTLMQASCDSVTDTRLAALELNVNELKHDVNEATIKSSKGTAESFIIDTWLVSCAASGSRFACASPGSVAAYHGALSRLRLGFKSRLGRFIFDFFSSIGASHSS